MAKTQATDPTAKMENTASLILGWVDAVTRRQFNAVSGPFRDIVKGYSTVRERAADMGKKLVPLMESINTQINKWNAANEAKIVAGKLERRPTLTRAAFARMFDPSVPTNPEWKTLPSGERVPGYKQHAAYYTLDYVVKEYQRWNAAQLGEVKGRQAPAAKIEGQARGFSLPMALRLIAAMLTAMTAEEQKKALALVRKTFNVSEAGWTKFTNLLEKATPIAEVKGHIVFTKPIAAPTTTKEIKRSGINRAVSEALTQKGKRVAVDTRSGRASKVSAA